MNEIIFVHLIISLNQRSFMRIYVCPVSGGAFPLQLGLLAECGLAGLRPDIVMGSSGGNVAAYIGLASDWQAATIPTIATQVNTTMFAQSWWPRYLNFFPSLWLGTYMGSVYASGTGAFDLFKNNFRPDNIMATEMWTGTMNRETGKGQLFCNLRQEDAKIRRKECKDLSASFRIRDVMPLTYLDGNIESISSVAVASAAIPVLVPEQKIFGARYVDGGTLFSSPLTALQDCLMDLIYDDEGSSQSMVGEGSSQSMVREEPSWSSSGQSNKQPATLHINYFSSFDLQSTSPTSCKNLYDNGTTTIGEMVKSLCIQDRLVAIELLRDGKKQFPSFIACDGSVEVLKRIEEIRTSTTDQGQPACLRSVLELYPAKDDSMDLLTFTGADILRLINSARAGYKLRFWWIPGPNSSLTEAKVRSILFPPSP